MAEKAKDSRDHVDELISRISKRLETSSDERRFQRKEANFRIFYRQVQSGGKEQKTHQGEVQDISQGGFRILASNYLAKGTIIVFFIKNRAEKDLLSGRGRVVRSGRVTGGSEIGVEFLEISRAEGVTQKDVDHDAPEDQNSS